jgi:tRNA-specific 2-thiouridylase
MLSPDTLERVVFPVGRLTKAEVRDIAARLGLRTADKPDSQDVCFIQSGEGRRHFLEDRIPLHEAELVDVDSGDVVGTVPAVELVTVGQRRGLGVAVDGRRRYALAVDVQARRIAVGAADWALGTRVSLGDVRWAARPLERGEATWAQTTAHGRAATCRWLGDEVVFDDPQPLVAPGQTVALYDAEDPQLVVGAAIAMTLAAPPAPPAQLAPRPRRSAE